MAHTAGGQDDDDGGDDDNDVMIMKYEHYEDGDDDGGGECDTCFMRGISILSIPSLVQRSSLEKP